MLTKYEGVRELSGVNGINYSDMLSKGSTQHNGLKYVAGVKIDINIRMSVLLIASIMKRAFVFQQMNDLTPRFPTNHRRLNSTPRLDFTNTPSAA